MRSVLRIAKSNTGIFRYLVTAFVFCLGILALYTIYFSKRASEAQTFFHGNTVDPARVIFVGGHESSGTGLLRVMLDAHPLIRCGAEPMVTLELLHLRHSMQGLRRKRAIKAGVYPEAYDQAVGAFILKIIEKMGPSAPYLCHKQPMTFNYLGYLGYLFPSAKFVHIVRDGRAVVASSIERGFNPQFKRDRPLEGLRIWDETVTSIIRDCQDLGPGKCFTMRYEKLILNPKEETTKLFEFLGIPWDPIILKHETILGNLTNLNPYEPSTRQFMRKIHNESLAKWANPGSVLPHDFIRIARVPLLKKLGYSDLGNPPDYQKLSPTVPYV
ncbi:hypothetical protein CRM22_008423 [Opisthorchis felineus]|uniref:Protein-tyrosine sulfotransferase n=1 Tax=Opisthorchis felineus TaxID=147828 RepID=A0A4S2LJI3_OPIFE|nr:hypothetical protein CRM22_008423 [Opisthorchis felineus]